MTAARAHTEINIAKNRETEAQGAATNAIDRATTASSVTNRAQSRAQEAAADMITNSKNYGMAEDRRRATEGSQTEAGDAAGVASSEAGSAERQAGEAQKAMTSADGHSKNALTMQQEAQKSDAAAQNAGQDTLDQDFTSTKMRDDTQKLQGETRSAKEKSLGDLKTGVTATAKASAQMIANTALGVSHAA